MSSQTPSTTPDPGRRLISRRRLLGCLAATPFAANLTPRLTAAAKRPPNVLFILADDLGYRETSCYGSPDIPTPHIDSIARGGVRFTDGYVSAAVCNPSRAGILTGCYQQRWGQELNGLGPKGWLPPARVCLAQALKDAGYATAIVGKWHMGMRAEQFPLARGFDEFFGMASGQQYIDPSKPGVHSVRIAGASAETTLFRNRERVREEEYLTDAFGREACSFIERQHAKPFFLYLAFNAPHVPIQATQKYYDRFPGAASEQRRIYAGMVSAMDDAVGRVLAKLRQHRLERDTLVVFLSDNGAPDYVEKTDNGPLTGYKRMLYEGGIRIPFILRWPARLPQGKVDSRPVSSLDLMPTILSAAGRTDARIPFDGVNLMPFLTRDRSAPHDYLYWRMGPNGAVRKGNWKLLKIGNEFVRLYDLSQDIGEGRDLSETHPDIVADLRAAYDRWDRQMEPAPVTERPEVTTFNGDRIAWHYAGRQGE